MGRRPRRVATWAAGLIVVDTSVWVDFFRGARHRHVGKLRQLIDADDGVALTDVVLTEILQGMPTEAEAVRMERRLDAFVVLRLESRSDFRRAASLFRSARASGFTIRRTLHCLIASVCIREDVPILHADEDFDRLASCTALEVISVR